MSTDNYVTAAEAAELAGVSPETFRGWRKRRLIIERSITRGERGHMVPLFDPHEVMVVERETRLADPSQKRARRLQ